MRLTNTMSAEPRERMNVMAFGTPHLAIRPLFTQRTAEIMMFGSQWAGLGDFPTREIPS
jgi:hypothetical protein